MKPTDKSGPSPIAARLDYLAMDDQQLLTHCDVETYRASGPGGQKRNKTDSAVRLRLRPAGLTALGTESRSQHENKARALRRLRLVIALELRQPVDMQGYEPPDVLQSCRTKSGRLEVGLRDGRYPRVVQEFLDLLAGAGWRLSDAADKLGISTAQLSTFVCRDVKLRDRVNRERALLQLKPLRA
jgi:hypothetical protein